MNVNINVVLFCVITTLLISVEGDLSFCGKYQYGTIEYKDEKQDYKFKLQYTVGNDKCAFKVQNINGEKSSLYVRIAKKKDDSTKVDLPEGKTSYNGFESKEGTLIHNREPNVDIIFTVYNN